MNTEYFVASDNQQKGPFTLSQLQEMWQARAVTATTLYWQPGNADWAPLSNIVGILEPATAGVTAMASPPGLPPMLPVVANAGAATPVSTTGRSSTEVGHAGVRYAEFWRRLLAILIDYTILTVGSIIPVNLIMALYHATEGVTGHGTANPAGGLGILIWWLYYALMESSRHQATLGKMILKIKVTDLDGQPISFGRASGRHFSKMISGLIFCVGFLMAAFTEKRQGLHDMIAGCLVVRR